MMMEKGGFLKPFPVGVPHSGNFTRVENFLLSTNSKLRTVKPDDYSHVQPTVEQTYQELKKLNSSK